MLKVAGQNGNIIRGLQIGKDREGENQRDDNSYEFNNIGLIDDTLIFVNTPLTLHSKSSIRCAGKNRYARI